MTCCSMSNSVGNR